MILVTGHRGFFGAAAVRALAAARVPHRLSEGDVRDRARLRASMAGCRAVLHLAARHEDREGDGFRCHPDSARALVEVASELGVERIVASSTAGVYGHRAHDNTDETSPEAPDTPHARSRAEADAVLLSSSVRAVVVRPRFVLGQGDRHVGPRLARLPLLLDGGRARWSTVDVDALARVLLALVDRPSPPILLVDDGRPVTVRELVARYRGRAPTLSLPSRLLPSALRESPKVRFLTTDQVFDTRLLRATLPELA